MINTVIEFKNASKRYHLREKLFSSRDYLWALRDISFTVAKGESVGLIGANGAGKTTVMRLVSSITRPTEGEVSVAGLVVPLISVEGAVDLTLTCRENIYLICALFGLNMADIRKETPEIIEFAGLRGFVDTQLKRLSRGMITRLSFSISVHVPADIMLIDEVLTLGDREFQDKCFTKINEYKRSGKTIIFVSHSMDDLRRICDRIIWFDKGRILNDGPKDTIIDEYSAAKEDPLS